MSVRTKFFILSDTHSAKFPSCPDEDVDVAIHCGDLTNGSMLEEFRLAIGQLKDLRAPLKLVIVGNHEFTLDERVFQKKLAEAGAENEQEKIEQAYGKPGEILELFREAKESHGVHLLEEGTHRFSLANGANLTVYASPYTHSSGIDDSDWGFQCRGDDLHFAIEEGTHVVVTHGPPEGVLDRTEEQKRAGASVLFDAVARTRPLLHCFGHIHHSWGARRVAWRETTTATPVSLSHFTAIDNSRSSLVESLATLHRTKFDDDHSRRESQQARRIQARRLLPVRSQRRR